MFKNFPVEKINKLLELLEKNENNYIKKEKLKIRRKAFVNKLNKNIRK